jgi:hypothetical protein
MRSLWIRPSIFVNFLTVSIYLDKLREALPFAKLYRPTQFFTPNVCN